MRSPVDPTFSLRMNLRRRLRFGDTRSHSRFVQRSKWVLPSLAVTLLMMVAIWPQLQATFEHMKFKLPRIDLSEARKLRMVQPKYTGIDKDSRPFTLTAEAATQISRTDDIVSLDGPKADMTTNSGNWVEVTSYAGTYQPQPQVLEMYGNVELYQDRGNEFHTDSARVDMVNGTAQGDEPVNGQGPFGNVIAEGFTMYNRGETIVFNGKTNLSLLPRAKEAE